jgi:hypothetical protein
MANLVVYREDFVSGAGDGDRTRDPLLGKLMLYHCDEHEDDWSKFETGWLLADLGTDFTAESGSPRYFFAVSSRLLTAST